MKWACPGCAAQVTASPGRKHGSRCGSCAAERSKRLAHENYIARRNAGRIKRPAPRPRVTTRCAWCGESTTGTKARIYCSRRCMEAANPRRCDTEGCDGPHAARGLCKSCWKRAYGKASLRPWNDKRRDAYHRRRAAKKAASSGSPVILADIAERDEWICHLCAGPVVRTLAYPDPMSPSQDHVIPLSAGGAHDPSNVRLAHLVCNVRKGSRILPDGAEYVVASRPV